MSAELKVTKKDIEEVWGRFNEAVKELETFEYRTSATKKEIILRLRDTVEILVEHERIPIIEEQISSYVWQLLNERGITYHYNTFIGLFTENQKRNYSKSSLSLHSHKFVQDDGIDKCDCGVIKVNGILYDEIPPDAKPKSSEEKSKARTELNDTEKYFVRVIQNLKSITHLYTMLLEKSTRDKNVEDVVNKVLTDLDKLTDEQKDIQAEIIAVTKQIDYRQRVAIFEKLKGVLLEKCLYNTAKVAKLLRITPKHMSANIIRKEFPELHDNTRQWFRVINVEIDGKPFVIDIADWFDRQYNRKMLGLDIRQPVVTKYIAN